jgi:anaerobic dimethyl sulfoxide reductase subunit A
VTDTSLIRTVCDPNCHASPRCGLTAHVEGGRIVRIEPGSFPLPEYDRRVCAMGMARLEQQYHKDRLHYPLRRAGERGQGRWQRISWDEAFDLLAERLRKIAEEYGSRSLAFFAGSGASGVLTKGSAQRFAAAVGGTAHRAGGVDYGVPKGLEYMFGVPASTYFRPGGHEMADAVNSRMILLWGGNGADTRLVDFHFIAAAQQRGTKLVCIDPNRSTTAQRADQWISPRPGTDTALALALLNEILRHGWQDDAFLRRHTNAPFLVRGDNRTFLRAADLFGGNAADYLVWDSSLDRAAAPGNCGLPALYGSYRVMLADGTAVDCAPAFGLLRELAQNYSAERAAAITGVPPETIRDLAREFALRKPAAIRIGYGVDRWYYCDYTARAAANLVVATGNIGIAGAGISVHDGTYVAPLDLRSFRSPGGREAATLDVVSLMKAIEHGDPYPVRALWLSASNMFNQTSANRARVLNTIVPKLDLLVAVDHFMTDTAALADIVLPACTIFEKKDLVAGMFLQLQRAVVEVDIDSGSLKILKFVSVHDCGNMLNPLIVRGQHLGALAHGFGGALYEELPYDENGQPLATSFKDYFLPTVMEMPELTIDHLVTPNPFTPGGFKGAGETGTVGPPAVLANAVEDALRPLDIKIRKVPLSPSYLWSLIVQARAAGRCL